MKNNHDDRILERILSHYDRIYEIILRYGNSYAQFVTDEDYQELVCFNIQQIGELTNQLTEEFKDQNKDKLPFRKIVNLRNQITHDYISINVRLIWNIIKIDIPQLVDFCKDNIDNNQPLTDKNHTLDPKTAKI